jgi:hypothetical protein
MTDYTREQQIRDIRASFAPRTIQIHFWDNAEEIVVHDENGRVYSYANCSDDDGVMEFFNEAHPYDTIIVHMQQDGC